MAEQPNTPATLAELLAQLREKGVPPEEHANHMRRFLDFKAREQGVPLNGKFELTPLCNLDCKMCYVHLEKEQMHGAELMRPDKWKDLMTQAMRMGMMEALLTGGECLTYPWFDEVYLHLHDLGVETTVFTNGILLDEKRIAFLKEHPAKSIQVSLYGSSEDAYERVTGHRQFGRVLHNLKAAKAADLPIHIAITPSVFMGADAENILRLAHELDIMALINWSLFDPREETGRQGQSMELPLEDYMRFYRLQYELTGRRAEPVDPMDLPDAGGPNRSIGRGLRCGAGRSGFSIGYDGRMRPCAMLRDIVAEPLQIGFEAAWKLINEAAENYPVPMECEGCSYRGACPICPVHHEKGAAPGCANPAICARARRMVEAGFSRLSID